MNYVKWSLGEVEENCRGTEECFSLILFLLSGLFFFFPFGFLWAFFGLVFVWAWCFGLFGGGFIICLGFLFSFGFICFNTTSGIFLFHSNAEQSQFWNVENFHIWNFITELLSSAAHHSASSFGISLEYPVNGLNRSIKWSWFWCFVTLSRQSVQTCLWLNYFITEIATAFAPEQCYLPMH